jgi:hypothetical protein
MDFYMMASLLGFVVANSIFSYKAGERAGKYDGIVGITTFFHNNCALKDKNTITEFDNWPIVIKTIYTTAQNENL